MTEQASPTSDDTPRTDAAYRSALKLDHARDRLPYMETCMASLERENAALAARLEEAEKREDQAVRAVHGGGS